ncbi:M48 family metallopeptidase [bacterium endosymbiont of Bathymodiolus sp. 5 South]|jgi:predicted Zn-dependent protease|uniref:M48 family metallopeptidase n=1 Tax=bacterium endosymbiont of Bathymodiolus sp. 5 South TaxID=1181670 RepID=UPI0010B09DC6|nr:M48 family metalloprotease [bacterium endosymbiont of Bathymodiolus sp. 5 South]CAC9647457.1 Exported zinc metalloprotease YfgC precursor [uncultured Gammaproteobacteria bacterium]CAC9650665.1 Exported zinc metalloprotease YfgC precursor [uncultured Gammaproteobacteria bacterium]SHN90749.1 Exported zinc metalloprotease YfgC precursor [bacterium endosymbiont of Bathymodiolus sp. 5 South]VVH56483.1 Exported zinc metalloprotease YfgC precursor [uncultured Gammaproteobacteria bacterium]VVH63189
MKILLSLLIVPLFAFALSVPELQLSESLDEKKRGGDFLQLIWDTDLVISDIEATTYLQKLGQELTTYSENPRKHFGFLFLKDDSINAFAGPYGYIGIHTGMLLSSDFESELAGVLCHEISHVTQNHLVRFSKKSGKQNYLLLAGMLAAALVDNNKASEAIFTSTLAGTLQQNINFTREHEWEADRIGTAMLKRSGFDPKGMANFFAKLKDSTNAQEFLQSHPLSINRIADSLQRSDRTLGSYRKDSFEYATIKAKLHYQKYNRIKTENGKAITYYMQAYQAFDEQNYKNAKRYIDRLLLIDKSKPSCILAGRIASKLGNVVLAQQYFNKNNSNEKDEASVYYAAKAYLDNQQLHLGISILKSFLRANQGNYESYKLLALLYLKQGDFGRSHIQSAKALIVQGKLDQAIGRYERAKTLVDSQDLYDIVNAKINTLKQIINLYK